GKREHGAAIVVQIPVDPVEFVVLAIGIVIAFLGAAELVAGDNHRRALGEQQGGHHVAHLSLAHFDDVFVVRGTFPAVVVREVVVGTVAVVFAVGFVVFVVVRHQIVQGKTVVGGDEVDG